MEQFWFKKAGWLYSPIGLMGYIVTSLAIIFKVPVTMAVIRSGLLYLMAFIALLYVGTCTAFWWKGLQKKRVVLND